MRVFWPHNLPPSPHAAGGDTPFGRGGVVRSFWKGAITFGLVTIPIRLYVATESKDPSLHYLHAADNAPVKYQKVCSACGAVLERSDIVLGYEFSPGRYVPVPEEELKELQTGDRHSAEILAFVPAESLDPIFLAKAYYAEPLEGAAKPYALLRRAMERSGRVALARLTLRTKPVLGLVRLHETGALLLETLFDPDEVRDASELTIPEEADVSEKELSLAMTLVDALAGPFEPAQVPDTYRHALEDLLARKAEVALATQPQEAATGKVVDLMAALEASIARAREEGAGVQAHAGRDVARTVR